MEHEHKTHNQNVPARFAIGFFIAIVVLAFLYIQFFANYSSSTTGFSPSPQQQPEAIAINPVAQRFLTFSTPDSDFTFEYPVEWYKIQLSEREWMLVDSKATEEAKLSLSVATQELVSSPEAALRCVGRCDVVVAGKKEFPFKRTELNNLITEEVAVATKKGLYILSTQVASDSADLLYQIDYLYSTIITED